LVQRRDDITSLLFFTYLQPVQFFLRPVCAAAAARTILFPTGVYLLRVYSKPLYMSAAPTDPSAQRNLAARKVEEEKYLGWRFSTLTNTRPLTFRSVQSFPLG
jgi:hypothetical protein